MRSENMSKSLLNTYHITKHLSPLKQIVDAKHYGDGSFYTGSRNLTLFLRMRTKEIVKSLGTCMPTIGIQGRRSEWQGQIFDRKLLNSRFRTWKSYYFMLTYTSQTMLTVNIN